MLLMRQFDSRSIGSNSNQRREEVSKEWKFADHRVQAHGEVRTLDMIMIKSTCSAMEKVVVLKSTRHDDYRWPRLYGRAAVNPFSAELRLAQDPSCVRSPDHSNQLRGSLHELLAVNSGFAFCVSLAPQDMHNPSHCGAGDDDKEDKSRNRQLYSGYPDSHTVPW